MPNKIFAKCFATLIYAIYDRNWSHYFFVKQNINVTLNCRRKMEYHENVKKNMLFIVPNETVRQISIAFNFSSCRGRFVVWKERIVFAEKDGKFRWNQSSVSRRKWTNVKSIDLHDTVTSWLLRRESERIVQRKQFAYLILLMK